MKIIALLALAAAMTAGATNATAITPVSDAPAGLRTAPLSIGGRVQLEGDPAQPTYRYQWPGTYFETAFKGSEIYFKVGTGNQILHLVVDGETLPPLVKPAPGLYRVDGLTKGKHQVALQVATESQAGPDTFQGFALPPQAHALKTKPRNRQIEFIGDSHTVGYGNISPTRQCTDDDVWATTDNTQAFATLTARHYAADYQVSAISGHGIVRNYNGGPGDPVPVAYPFTLFDKKTAYVNSAWSPRIIVIALGTNDFSTPLNPGEKWPTHDALQTDYETTYVKFLQHLKARYPGAFIVLWSTAGGEIEPEVRKVLGQFEATGGTRTGYFPVSGLAMTGCNWHPSTADDQTISGDLVQFIDSHPGIWAGK